MLARRLGGLGWVDLQVAEPAGRPGRGGNCDSQGQPSNLNFKASESRLQLEGFLRIAGDFRVRVQLELAKFTGKFNSVTRKSESESDSAAASESCQVEGRPGPASPLALGRVGWKELFRARFENLALNS